MTPEQIEQGLRDREAADAKYWRDMRSPENQFRNMVGDRYKDCTLDNFRIAAGPADVAKRQADVVQQLRAIAADVEGVVLSGKNVILAGSMGTGKDHLMAAMLRVCFERRAGGMRVPFRRVDGAIFAAMCRDVIDKKTTEQDFLAEWVDHPLVAVSDPEGARSSEFHLDWFFRVVEARYREMKPTWITVNATGRVVDGVEDFAKLLGPRTWDRLKHDAIIIRCDWPSFRRPDSVLNSQPKKSPQKL